MATVMNKQVEVFADIADLSFAAATVVCTFVQERVKEQGCCTIALAGGKTPERLYQHLAEQPFQGNMPWDKTYLFWGDERFVSHTHPDSNFGMTWRSLLSRLTIPPQNVYPIPVEAGDAATVATLYETQLTNFFAGKGLVPAFDLILLGLGSDGHTASLFPGNTVVAEKERWVAASNAPSGAERITLTLPAINSARMVLFLVAGAEKQLIVKSLLNSEGEGRRYPAGQVHPTGKLLWFLDKAAASKYILSL